MCVCVCTRACVMWCGWYGCVCECACVYDVCVWCVCVYVCARMWCVWRGREQEITIPSLHLRPSSTPYVQVLAEMVEMYVSQHNPAAAMTVFRNILHQPDPASSLPPCPVLAGLCRILEKARVVQDLQTVVEGLIQHGRVVRMQV